VSPDRPPPALAPVRILPATGGNGYLHST
jgi:hypothetical protein